MVRSVRDSTATFITRDVTSEIARHFKRTLAFSRDVSDPEGVLEQLYRPSFPLTKDGAKLYEQTMGGLEHMDPKARKKFEMYVRVLTINNLLEKHRGQHKATFVFTPIIGADQRSNNSWHTFFADLKVTSKGGKSTDYVVLSGSQQPLIEIGDLAGQDFFHGHDVMDYARNKRKIRMADSDEHGANLLPNLLHAHQEQQKSNLPAKLHLVGVGHPRAEIAFNWGSFQEYANRARKEVGYKREIVFDNAKLTGRELHFAMGAARLDTPQLFSILPGELQDYLFATRKWTQSGLAGTIPGPGPYNGTILCVTKLLHPPMREIRLRDWPGDGLRGAASKNILGGATHVQLPPTELHYFEAPVTESLTGELMHSRSGKLKSLQGLKRFGRGFAAFGVVLAATTAYSAIQNVAQARVQDGNRVGPRARRAISDGAINIAANWSPDITDYTTDVAKFYAREGITSLENRKILA